MTDDWTREDWAWVAVLAEVALAGRTPEEVHRWDALRQRIERMDVLQFTEAAYRPLQRLSKAVRRDWRRLAQQYRSPWRPNEDDDDEDDDE